LGVAKNCAIDIKSLSLFLQIEKFELYYLPKSNRFVYRTIKALFNSLIGVKNTTFTPKIEVRQLAQRACQAVCFKKCSKT